MENLLNRFSGRHFLRRTVIMLLAVTLMGVGVGVFMHARMGSDPFSTLNLGVSSQIGLSFGTWQAIFNLLLIVLVLFLDRSMLGIGTIGNMFVIGFVADFISAWLSELLPPAGELGILPRVLLTLLGVAFMLVGCSFYMTCDLGMAPYDAISYIGPRLTKIPFRWWRMGCDVTIVAIGFACGAAVGIGTLIMAFFTGPILPLLNRHLAAPLVGMPAPEDKKKAAEAAGD